MRNAKNCEADVLLKNFDETDIAEECIFNKMHLFHIAVNLRVDIAHDGFEGFCAVVISKVITFLVKQGIIHLPVLNNRMECFPYNDCEKHNKPEPLYFTESKKGEKKIKFRQSAAQGLCLTRYLGLMIGDLIDVENKHWQLYLYLWQIIDILTSPR